MVSLVRSKFFRRLFVVLKAFLSLAPKFINDIYWQHCQSTPTTSYLIVVVQSPSLHWGGSKLLVNSPRFSSSGDPLTEIFLLVFYSCFPLSGHRWMAFLIPKTVTLFIHLPNSSFYSIFQLKTSFLFISAIAAIHSHAFSH